MSSPSPFVQIEEAQPSYPGPALLSSGHRVFFLLMALSGVVLLSLWLYAYLFAGNLSSSWHGHEMVFGFASAAISGFLMAAVPKWTNTANFQGRNVVILAVVWFAGRLGVFLAEINLELYMLSWIDLFYIPLITYCVARRLTIAGNKRNYIVPAVMICWFFTNVMWHVTGEIRAVYSAIYLVTALSALISARIVPAFTQNALVSKYQKKIECSTPKWAHLAPVVLIVFFAFLVMFEVNSVMTGFLAIVISAILFFRMRKWHSFKTLDMPIVWVLHAAYIWLPIGFLLRGFADFGVLVEQASALHALSIGAIGLLILAVASRAALGHAGVAVVASHLTVLSYVLVLIAVLLRTLAQDDLLIVISGFCWVLGFCLFSFEYAPLLLKKDPAPV